MKKELFLEEARLGARDPALIEYDESPRRRSRIPSSTIMTAWARSTSA